MTDYIHVDLTLSPHEAEKCTNIIARQYEDNCVGLMFKVPEDLSDKNMYLDFEKPDGSKFKTPRLTIDGHFAEYEIGNNLTDIPGTLKMDVLFGSEDYLWKSFTRTFVVKSAINATQEIVDGNPDWVSHIDDIIGDLNDLDTKAKDKLVNAINEAYNHSVNQIYMGENEPTDENILIWIDTYVPPITGTQLITADNLEFITSDDEIFLLHEPAMLLTSDNKEFIEANNKNFILK